MTASISTAAESRSVAITPAAGFAGPILVGLVVLHTVGALWHHFIDRDGTLTRMLPGKDR